MTSESATFDSDSNRQIGVGNERRLSSLERLIKEPYRFDFFQAVRLLELVEQSHGQVEKIETANPVGYDFAPDSEGVRFRVTASQSFPGSEIMAFTPANKNRRGSTVRSPAQMTVSFLGLTGPSGVLPQHYTQRLIDELRHDQGMREFFDIFNHRLISLFYRVWKKHRFPITYESDSLSKQRLMKKKVDARDSGDLFTYGMYCLNGMGSGGLRGRQVIPDEGLLFYGGLLSNQTPQAISLERMVSDYFGLPTEVIQFVGQWLHLSNSDQTSLSSNGRGSANKQLGVTAIAGSRVWSIENKFRVRLGPLDYTEFWSFIPGIRQLTPLAQFVRSYVGPEFDFEVQLVLRQEEVPSCRLGGKGKYGAHLGWNTWVFGQSLGRDADEAVFQVEGRPETQSHD